MRIIYLSIVVFVFATLLNNVCCLNERSDAHFENNQFEIKHLKPDDTFANFNSDHLNDYFALLKKKIDDKHLKQLYLDFSLLDVALAKYKQAKSVVAYDTYSEIVTTKLRHILKLHGLDHFTDFKTDAKSQAKSIQLNTIGIETIKAKDLSLKRDDIANNNEVVDVNYINERLKDIWKKASVMNLKTDEKRIIQRKLNKIDQKATELKVKNDSKGLGKIDDEIAKFYVEVLSRGIMASNLNRK